MAEPLALVLNLCVFFGGVGYLKLMGDHLDLLLSGVPGHRLRVEDIGSPLRGDSV